MHMLRQFARRLELFEWVGIAASMAALYVFFVYAGRLDEAAGQPGYHWRMVAVVTGIYARFIPWALVVGLGVFALWAYIRRDQRHLIWRRYGFGVRVFLAYCVLLVVFRVVNFYVPVLHPGLRDDALQQMDAAVFGGQQVAQWLLPLAHPWLTYALSGVYVAWFWLLFFTLLLLLTAGREAVTEYVFASLVTFYTGYVCYVLVPVIGPGYTLPLPALGGISPHFTVDRQLIARDCFPSLHTALSVLMCIYVWRFRRYWTWLYAPAAGLIIFSTLYLRFHYGMDDVAGAALAIVVSQFAPVCHATWRRLQRSVAAAPLETGIGRQIPAY